MGYLLVNPMLSNPSIKMNTDKKLYREAGHEIWNNLSRKIKNYTPEFYFTIQNAESGDLHHFVVSESYEDSRVKYTLDDFDGPRIDVKAFKEELNKRTKKSKGSKKIRGGKPRRKFDDSSSDSDSSSPEVVYTFPTGTTPGSTVLTYYPTIYGVPNIMFPTFASSLATFTNIGVLPNTFFFTVP